ncbi:hypothetical protein BDL97_18G074900 [Sphagnum fallax]|nr:hypothetical protein BDL97_18G074900 [Sphagnum fallax]
MQWRYEIDVVTDFLLVRRGRRSRRRKRRTSSGFCVLIMEGEGCSVCGEGRLTLDPVYGVIACDVCGRVVNEMETQLASKHQMGHVMERGGTFVAAEDTGAIAAGGVSIYGDGSAANLHRNFINRQEMNKMEVMKTMRRITSVLRVPTEKVRDVKFMLESVLENEWGQGRWIEILVGACIYIAIRQSQLPLTLLEVAATVDCNVVELAQMYQRVLKALEIDLPDTDLVVFLDRAISTLSTVKLGKDMTRQLSKQGGLLLECAREWFISTGRRPLPVVAAVLALILDANQIDVNFDEVVRELYSNNETSKARLKELQEALVGVGKNLPWGQDITVKTLRRHMPFLLQYLEMDMKCKKKRKSSVLTSISTEGITMTSNSKQKDVHHAKRLQTGTEVSLVAELQEQAMSSEQYRTMPSSEGKAGSIRPPPSDQEAHTPEQPTSVELQLLRVMKMKQAEWEALPPSFLASREARNRRCAKISAAKDRISKAKKMLITQVPKKRNEPLTSIPRNEVPVDTSEHPKVAPPGSSGQESEVSIDWEDLLIEYLILGGVKLLCEMEGEGKF